MHVIASNLICMYLLRLKNKRRAIFCTYKLRLNSYIVLSFGYLQFSRSVDVATEKLLALRTQAYQYMEWMLL